MSCAWKDERCRIGLILGTGTNACYLEEIKDIHTIDQDAYNDKNGHMVINTEWVRNTHKQKFREIAYNII